MACLEVKCKFSQLKEGRGAVKALQKCLETAEQRLEFPLLFVSKKKRGFISFSARREGAERQEVVAVQDASLISVEVRHGAVYQ